MDERGSVMISTSRVGQGNKASFTFRSYKPLEHFRYTLSRAVELTESMNY